MSFSVGDKVKIVDEQSEGEIIRIDNSQIWVLTDLGFEFPYLVHQLILLKPSGEQVFTPRPFELKEKKTQFGNAQMWKFPSIHLHTKGIPEIDLHIEELVDKDHLLSSYEKLNLQLDFLREVLEKAKSQKVRRLILIHGVGQGVLRSAVLELIANSYPDIEYLDADYLRYGYGATEIIIHNLYR